MLSECSPMNTEFGSFKHGYQFFDSPAMKRWSPCPGQTWSCGDEEACIIHTV